MLKPRWNTVIIAILSGFILVFQAGVWAATPITFRDSTGTQITLAHSPKRVVSLCPSITEILFAIGAGDTIQGVTYHSSRPAEANFKQLVGGYVSPSWKAIAAMEPDVIFISDIHRNLMEKLAGPECAIIELKNRRLSDSFNHILLLGNIFNRRENAAQLVRTIREQLDLIRQKIANIPVSKRLRTLRLMGRDAVMTPGDDSFQNEVIRAAGGVPPQWGKTGPIVSVTLEEWKRFNPQVIYGCGEDRIVAETVLKQPGWKDVDAVKNGHIFYFPCDLTCRAATHTGDFVQWLAATMYADEFSDSANQVFPDQVVSSRPVPVDIDYVASAVIAASRIHDFTNKSLIIDFKTPMTVVSTLEGQRTGIRTVGNHYSSPPCWPLDHRLGLAHLKQRVFQTIEREPGTTSFLFTGADMDNLSIQKRSFRQMRVWALVTAGVQSNAVRMSADTGPYYEPGTINIIVLPEMCLSPRAMTRAIISATEAKTAALMDMDIRSSENPVRFQATGTGTDNIIVAQGTGVAIENAGGHSKMGELIAKAVYAGVQEAIRKQNALIGSRNIFQRLKERRIDPFSMIRDCQCHGDISQRDRLNLLQEILLEPKYAGFLEAALALSDAHQRGLIQDLSMFEAWCSQTAQQIAGRPLDRMAHLAPMGDDFPIMNMALDAILNGVEARLEAGHD